MMRALISIIKKNKGQSVLEFAFMLPFIFFFIFIHIQLCISYILAEYTKYVSYMSARTVLTNGHLDNRHIGVVNRYIPLRMRGLLQVKDPKLIKYNNGQRRFVSGSTNIEKGTQKNINFQNDQENRHLGVELEYTVPIFLPFIREFKRDFHFKAISVLGREPYHGGMPIKPWEKGGDSFGDSYGDKSACDTVFNDNGC